MMATASGPMKLLATACEKVKSLADAELIMLVALLLTISSQWAALCVA
jgi:hypothetical protein